MNNAIDNQKKIIKLILPALIIGLYYLISVKYGNMVYLTNDDTSIQDTLAGNMTGRPYLMHQFINVLISFPLAFLYKIFPTIQWWYVWSHILIILGMLFINYSIVILSKKNNFPYIMAISLVILTDIIFILYTISNVSFTIVPAILGAGVVAILFLVDDNNKKILAFVGVICFAVLLAHRSMVGKVLLCYILLSVVHSFIDRKLWKKDFLKLCVIFGGLLCLTFCVETVNSGCQERVNGRAFQEYNDARGHYMDYPHDTFEENPEIYEHVRWDYDTYRLVHNWCFLDENVTAENFDYLIDNSIARDNKEEALVLEYIIEDLNNPLVKSALVIWVISILICFCAVILGRKISFLITLLFNVGGSLFLIVYQLYSGRILYRTLIIILLPSLIINFMLIISSYSQMRNKKNLIFLLILLIGASIIGGEQVIEYTFDSERLLAVEESIDKDQKLKQYATSNKDNVYIKQTGISLSISPYGANLDEKATNIIRWGDSTFYSDAFCEKLANNGIDELNGSVFMRDNVFLISSFDAMKTMERDEDNIFCIFYNWLKNHYNAIGFVKVEDICEGIYVYKFVFEDNISQFDYYYDYEKGKLLKFN